MRCKQSKMFFNGVLWADSFTRKENRKQRVVFVLTPR